MTYYDRDGIIVRDSTDADAKYIGENMREADKEEILSSSNSTPHDALYSSLRESLIVMTVEYRKEPILMFGIIPETLLGNRALIWMLSSNGIRKIKKPFIKNNKKFIEMFLKQYCFLFNFVHAKNTVSILWLRWLGAVIEEPIIYGVNGEKFHPFYFIRN